MGSNSADIVACYATGAATGDQAGGLVGSNSARIVACYAIGAATGSQAGGLVGDNTGGDITDSYFDSSLHAATPGVGGGTDVMGLSKTTAGLRDPVASGTIVEAAIYAAWNIDIENFDDDGVPRYAGLDRRGGDDPWDFGSDTDYPVLRINVSGDQRD